MVYKWLLIEQSCLLCDQPDDAGRNICLPCEADLPWLGHHCPQCALPMPQSQLVCGACLKRPPAFARVEVPWRYAFPVDNLITRFKHQAQWPIGRLLAGLLSQHLHNAFGNGLARPDLLLPVPLARVRQRQRGFNQAQMLARWLSETLVLPMRDDLLLRCRETTAQQGLDAAERKRNLRNAFALQSGADLRGQHLALVDDVLTTGTTADAIARLLLRAGAATVDVYCLARTPRPGDH